MKQNHQRRKSKWEVRLSCLPMEGSLQEPEGTQPGAWWKGKVRTETFPLGCKGGCLGPAQPKVHECSYEGMRGTGWRETAPLCSSLLLKFGPKHRAWVMLLCPSHKTILGKYFHLSFSHLPQNSIFPYKLFLWLTWLSVYDLSWLSYTNNVEDVTVTFHSCIYLAWIMLKCFLLWFLYFFY